MYSVTSCTPIATMDSRILLVFALLGLTQSKVVDLPCKDIRAFVDGHNARRLKLAKGEISGQPAASKMKYMIWDQEIAAKAAKWASGNKFSHNPDRKLGSGRFTVGENIFWTASTNMNYKLNIASVLDSWFSEHKNYKFGPLKNSDFSSSSKAIGHYTQMAWSNSVYLGCGVSEDIKNGWKNFYVVCEYGPTGNFIGQTPYESNGKKAGTLTCSIGNCNQPYGKLCKK